MMKFGYDSKILLRDVLMSLGQKELEIEELRQRLCSVPDFDPYLAFKRIVYPESCGYIDGSSLVKFMKENQHEDLHILDFEPLVRYFSLRPKAKTLSYQEFLGLILPCASPLLRCHVI